MASLNKITVGGVTYDVGAGGSWVLPTKSISLSSSGYIENNVSSTYGYDKLVVFTPHLPNATTNFNVGYYNYNNVFTWTHVNLSKSNNSTSIVPSDLPINTGSYILPIKGNNFIMTLALNSPIFYNSNILLYEDYSVQSHATNYKKFTFKDSSYNTAIIACTGATSAGCLKSDTLITMADGTTKRIDSIVVGDVVVVWDQITKNNFTSVVIENSFSNETNATCYDKWTFEDGTVLDTVNDHQLFNATKLKSMKMSQWEIGDCAVRKDGAQVKLVSHETISEPVRYADIKLDSDGYFFANGLVTMQ